MSRVKGTLYFAIWMAMAAIQTKMAKSVYTYSGWQGASGQTVYTRCHLLTDFASGWQKCLRICITGVDKIIEIPSDAGRLLGKWASHKCGQCSIHLCALNVSLYFAIRMAMAAIQTKMAKSVYTSSGWQGASRQTVLLAAIFWQILPADGKNASIICHSIYYILSGIQTEQLQVGSVGLVSWRGINPQ